jgi:lipopolysaccharide export system protein LptA
VYRTFHPADQQAEPTAEARVSGNVKALSEDADLTSESLTVFFGPEAGAQDPDKLKLEARKVETKGNAHAKMFMPEGNYYRYARGDSLEWDRLGGRMVVMSDAGDAVVWDNSNEWTGKRLVVNQTPEGRVEAESTSGRRITFYEEGTPRAPSGDARQWKPIY